MTLKLNGTNSVAAPAYAGDDADTGLQCGTNELKLVTGGTARATVDSSGRLLVGTTSALDKFDTNKTPRLQVSGTSKEDSSISITRWNTGNTAAPVLFFGGTNSAAAGTYTLVNDDEALGLISFEGTDGSKFVPAATIEALVDGTPGADDMPGRLVFSTTADGASSSTERMRLTKTGTLCINNTSGQSFGEVLKVQNSGSSGNCAFIDFTSTDDRAVIICKHAGSSGGTNRQHIAFLNSSGANVGSIRSHGSSTSYNTSSDHRLKENIVDLDGAITRVKQLAPKRFNFIADTSTTVDGFLAHEAQTVVPEAVTGTHDEVDDDGNAVMQCIDQSKLVPLLTAALQEAIAKIETLETKVAALEAAS